MAVMDEFKEEREAMKHGTPKEKLAYFFYYYKWHVGISAVVIILVVTFIVQLCSNKEDALYVCMLNALTKTDEGYLDYSEPVGYGDAFAEYAGIDTSEYDVRFDTSIQIDYSSLDESTITSAQKYMAYLAAAQLDVIVTDEASLESSAYQQDFYDLREILSAEQLEKYSPYFYYIDMTVVAQRDELLDDPNNLSSELDLEIPDPRNPEAMDDPVPVGIYLDTCTDLKDRFYFRGEDIVGCVFGNTKHLEASLKYFDFLFENE